MLDLGPDSGPHYVALTGDEKRLVISDYFLNDCALEAMRTKGFSEELTCRVATP